MTHPDPGAAHPDAAPAEAGEWILARVLGDAIAHAMHDGSIDVDPEVTDAALAEACGRAAAAALVFITTTGELLDDGDLVGIPLFALRQQLPPEIRDAPPSVATPGVEGQPAPSAPGELASTLDLMAAVRAELAVAFPTKRRQRAWLAGELRRRRKRLLRQCSDDELRTILEAAQAISDAFRRREVDA